MSLYPLALFAHIVGVLGLFMAIGLLRISMLWLQQAQTTAQVRERVVLATWHIRSRKDGFGLPDHYYPWARNSIEGQGKPVLLAV